MMDTKLRIKRDTMTTCSERIYRNIENKKENFDRLQDYFHALEHNQLEDYHKKHKRCGDKNKKL